jgi:hypothetical protein
MTPTPPLDPIKVRQFTTERNYPVVIAAIAVPVAASAQTLTRNRVILTKRHSKYTINNFEIK